MPAAKAGCMVLLVQRQTELYWIKILATGFMREDNKPNPGTNSHQVSQPATPTIIQQPR